MGIFRNESPPPPKILDPLLVVGECPAQKYIFYLEINYAEQNGYLKIFIGCVWGNDGRGGG
jgi:hypothetical protein